MHKKKGKKGYAIFNIDFKKAHDQVDRNFLRMCDILYPTCMYIYIYNLKNTKKSISELFSNNKN